MNALRIVAVLAAMSGQAEVGDAGAADRDGSEAAAHYARFRELAESHVVFVDSRGNTRAVLRDKDIFRWTNPLRGSIAGAVYLWTHQGRPHATIGVWRNRTATMDSYELQSLSTGPLVTRATGYPDWNPRVAGLEFAPLPAAPPPADSAVRRLAQMRGLGRERFSALLVTEKLRMLPQPIYRYEGKLPPGVLDGAMFSFAQGTDPELLLLLEARTADGPSPWHFAFAPSTSGRVYGILDGERIWDNADQLSKGTFVNYSYR